MDELVELIRWALLLLGWVYAITEASIAASFRMAFASAGGPVAETFIYCSACVGFWVGAALGALHLWPFDIGYWAIGESAFAAMALAHTWTMAAKGGVNSAYLAEQVEAPDDDATEEEDG